MRQPNEIARPAQPIAGLLDQLLEDFEQGRPERPIFMMAPRLRQVASELPRRAAAL
jgi:hypothetical protein